MTMTTNATHLWSQMGPVLHEAGFVFASGPMHQDSDKKGRATMSGLLKAAAAKGEITRETSGYVAGRNRTRWITVVSYIGTPEAFSAIQAEAARRMAK